MLKQLPDKNKDKSVQSQVFDAVSFDFEHPFSSCGNLFCSYSKGSCHCTKDKIVSYNHYVYRKIVYVDGVRTVIPLQRMVIDLDPERNPIHVRFEIKNWKCCCFEKTSAEKRKKLEAQLYHAFLPDLIPKYGRFTYRFIFSVLIDYVTRSGETVRKLCSRWSIAVSTLYRWIETFNDQFSLIVSEISSLTDGCLEKKLNTEKLFLLMPQLLHSFYLCTGGITFMEQRAWARVCGRATK